MKLPIQNLSALPTFVMVAKHLNFTKAAGELNLTQGAVSIQIRQLEEELGFALFKRYSRRIALTVEGKDLLEVVEPSLKQIATRIQTIKSRRLDDTLTVSTLPSFAAKWLIPRLLQFKRLYPEIDLRVHTSDHPVDFAGDRVDCAIRYGLGNYPGLYVEHIIDEVFFPVFSPDLIEPEKPLQHPADVRHYPILHDDYATEDYNITWKQWSESMGISDLDTDRGLQFGQSDFVIQAALAGQGIALAKISLAGDDLKSGLLVPLPNSSVLTKYSYYFVCPPEFSSIPKVSAFKNWIVERLKEEVQAAKIILKS